MTKDSFLGVPLTQDYINAEYLLGKPITLYTINGWVLTWPDVPSYAGHGPFNSKADAEAWSVWATLKLDSNPPDLRVF